MSEYTLKPVYDIQHFDCEVRQVSWENFDSLMDTIANGWVVIWQHHAVFVGEIINGTEKWLGGSSPVKGEDHLVRLRAFDQDHEYHFWRCSNGIKGRLRFDKPGSGVECIDTRMILRGVAAEPLQKAQIKFDPKKPISIRTRNYIDYHPQTQQAGYVDSRFVDFYKKLNG